MAIENLVFIPVFIAVISFFTRRIFTTWHNLFTFAKGEEENRQDQKMTRLTNMLTGGLLQRRMFKELDAGIMHFMIFWGFLTVSIGTLETIVKGFYWSFSARSLLGEGSFYQFYALLQDIGNSAVMLAISYAILRRIFFPPERLKSLSQSAKKDAFIVLLFIFSLVTSALLTMGSEAFLAEHFTNFQGPLVGLSLYRLFFAHITSPEIHMIIQKILWWLHVATLFGFMIFLPFSKHQHLIWVWPNMFFKNLKGTGRLRPMAFKEDAESFGVGDKKDFTWKQYLDGITCVECGRCTSQCPAYATGKPLDPRKMIHHLKESFQDLLAQKDDKPLIGGQVSQDELWACTTCGACMEACPLHIEHIPTIVDMRRYMTMTQGEMPAELQVTLGNLENQKNPWGFNNDNRADWAKGLSVTSMKENKDVEYLFWVGCAGSFDERYKKVSRSIVQVLQQAGIKFSILGKEEQCNGDTARRAGNEYLANMQIEENIQTMKRYDVKKIVTGCPHCFNTIKNEYPDFGYSTEVIHHSTLIKDLLQQGKIKLSPQAEKNLNITYHDSCYLGRHNKIYDAPREILQNVPNAQIKEMPRNREQGFCCGAGGARMWMEETIGERINTNRAKEAIATGAQTIATACPFCMTMLKDGVSAEKKENEVEVKDISEIIAEHL